MSTRPSVSSVAVCPRRARLILLTATKVRLVGANSSAVALSPPAIRTRPSASTLAVCPWRGPTLDQLDVRALVLAETEFGGGNDVVGVVANRGDAGFLAFGFEQIEAHGIDGDRVAAEVQAGVRPRVLRLERRTAGVASHQRV